MKVCFVTDYLPGLHSNWSGAEMVCLRLSDMVAQNGDSVTFCVTHPGDKRLPGNVYSIPTPFDKIEYLKKFLPFDPVSFFSSLIVLRKMKPDIIHFHCHLLFLPVLASAKLLGIPTVLTTLDHWNICPNGTLSRPDNTICDSFQGSQCGECFPRQLPLFSRKILGNLRAKVFDRSLRACDCVIALTHTSQAVLEKYGLPRSQLITIYHYQLGNKIPNNNITPFEQPTILFVGSLLRYKGLHIILQSLPSIISKINDAKLLIVGSSADNRYKSEINALIKRTGIENNVSFLGKLDNEKVLEIIARSHVVVVPEQWSSSFGPVVLVEAMALGKPVIASRIGSTPEFIDDGVSGFLVEYDKPEQFTDRITWILQHGDEARIMGIKAREKVSFLYKEHQEQEITKLYQDIIQRKDGPHSRDNVKK